MRLVGLGLGLALLGLPGCDKAQGGADASVDAAQVQGVMAAATVEPALDEDWPVNPEDGDLVGTELHGDMAPVAGGEAHPRDLPRLYPAAYAQWQSYVARVNHDDRGFVDSLDSTSTPMSFVTVKGQPYVKGWVCEMHNCAGNEVIFLMSPDQSRMIGYLRLALENGQEVERVIGPVKPDELQCMKDFMDDNSGRTSC